MEWDTVPEVPVTVTWYVPAGVPKVWPVFVPPPQAAEKSAMVITKAKAASARRALNSGRRLPTVEISSSASAIPAKRIIAPGGAIGVPGFDGPGASIDRDVVVIVNVTFWPGVAGLGEAWQKALEGRPLQEMFTGCENPATAPTVSVNWAGVPALTVALVG